MMMSSIFSGKLFLPLISLLGLLGLWVLPSPPTA